MVKIFQPCTEPWEKLVSTSLGTHGTRRLDDVCFSEDIYPAGLTVSLEALQKLWSAEMNRVRLGWIQNVLPKQSEAQLFSSVITSQMMKNSYVRVYSWLFQCATACVYNMCTCFHECYQWECACIWIPNRMWMFACLVCLSARCTGLSDFFVSLLEHSNR